MAVTGLRPASGNHAGLGSSGGKPGPRQSRPAAENDVRLTKESVTMKVKWALAVAVAVAAFIASRVIAFVEFVWRESRGSDLGQQLTLYESPRFLLGQLLLGAAVIVVSGYVVSVLSTNSGLRTAAAMGGILTILYVGYLAALRGAYGPSPQQIPLWYRAFPAYVIPFSVTGFYVWKALHGRQAT